MANAISDDPVIADTRAIIDARPDVLLATTAYGVRRWFEVADAAGLGEDLLDALADTAILVRGPKARGGIRAAGLNDVGMSAEETTESLIDEVLATRAAGPHGRGAAARLPEPVAARPPARRARPGAHRRAVPLDRDRRGRRPGRPAHRRRLLGRARLHHLHERTRGARPVQRRGGARPLRGPRRRHVRSGRRGGGRSGHGGAARRGRDHADPARALPHGRAHPARLRAPRVDPRHPARHPARAARTARLGRGRRPTAGSRSPPSRS